MTIRLDQRRLLLPRKYLGSTFRCRSPRHPHGLNNHVLLSSAKAVGRQDQAYHGTVQAHRQHCWFVLSHISSFVDRLRGVARAVKGSGL